MAKEPAQKTKTESKGKEAEQKDAGTQPLTSQCCRSGRNM